MKFCPKCGTIVSGIEVCPKCGTPTNNNDVVKPVSPKKKSFFRTIIDSITSKSELTESQATPTTKEKMTIKKETSSLTVKEDYAIAAMLNYCKRGKPIGIFESDYPQYLYYKYEIKNPAEYQKRLIEKNYLTENDPAVELRKKKVADLKKILIDNGISDKGKKEDLIQRICAAIDIKSLDIKTTYIPSEKGLDHLKKYGFITRLSKYNISLDEYNNYVKSNSKLKQMQPNDIIWGILNNKFITFNSSKEYGLARCEQLYMSYLLIDEGRFPDALFHLIIVLYYDTSGRDNGRRIPPEEITIYPGILSLVLKYKEYFTKDMVTKCCRTYKLSGHYLTNEAFHIFIDKLLKGLPADELESFIKNNVCPSAKKKPNQNSDAEYKAWLDYLSKGGTTEEWNRLKNIDKPWK